MTRRLDKTTLDVPRPIFLASRIFKI